MAITIVEEVSAPARMNDTKGKLGFLRPNGTESVCAPEQPIIPPPHHIMTGESSAKLKTSVILIIVAFVYAGLILAYHLITGPFRDVQIPFNRLS